MLVDSTLAWVPIILADVWKTTPFVALLLLAGLQNIDPHLYDAARTDGAGPWQQLWHVTLPLLRPTILVVLVFRSLDAFRVFDLVYVMTGGGPGTATEPVSLLSFTTLLRDLRFGLGAAIAVVIFVLTLLLALLYTRLLREEEPR
jgi:ABC-type sugar transport system permease subunit